MVELDSIDVLGAGPSGLYVAQLLKRHLPKLNIYSTQKHPLESARDRQLITL